MELVPINNQTCPYCGGGRLTLTWMISKVYPLTVHSVRFRCKDCDLDGIVFSEALAPEIADEY